MAAVMSKRTLLALILGALLCGAAFADSETDDLGEDGGDDGGGGDDEGGGDYGGGGGMGGMGGGSRHSSKRLSLKTNRSIAIVIARAQPPPMPPARSPILVQVNFTLYSTPTLHCDDTSSQIAAARAPTPTNPRAVMIGPYHAAWAAATTMAATTTAAAAKAAAAAPTPQTPSRASLSSTISLSTRLSLAGAYTRPLLSST